MSGNGNAIKPEPFQGGQIRFVRAGSGNLDGKFTEWNDSVKVRGITRDEMKLPIVLVKALYERIKSDEQVQEWLGVSG